MVNVTSILGMTFFGNTLLQYFIFFGILAGAAIIGKIAYYITKNFVKIFTAKTKTVLDDMLIEVAEYPAIFLIFIIGFYIAYKSLTLSENAEATFFNILMVMFIVNLTWFFTRLLDGVIKYYLIPFSETTNTDMDDALIPIIRPVGKVMLVLISAIIVLDKFGYNVTSLVAGLGIGGLAIALAAQETLSNVFGGVTLLTDRPFALGDRVRLSNKEGFVKEIGIRSTKITTMDGSELVIPNAVVSKDIIENVTREKERRIKLTLGLVYNTSSKKLDKAIQLVKQIVEAEEGITKKKCDVFFDEFASSSLNLVVTYWIKDLTQIFKVKNDINFKIKEAFEKEKIEFAFPTQTIYTKKE
ncbi:MAG: mechanosensitive ion channel family protein [Candidatus Woesearchaeota archaeon]|jgi:MscS family membrane protein